MIKVPAFGQLLVFLTKRSPREKLVLAAAFLVIATAFIDRVIGASLSRKLKDLDAQIETKTAEVRKNLRIMAQKRRIEVQHVKYRPYVGMMTTENEEFTTFLKEVDTLARESGVYVLDLKPTGTKAVGDSKRYLINLNIEAEMGVLVKFIYAIEDSKKLMTVEKYQISPKSKDSHAAKCSMIISKMVIPQ
jgi:hypothetical protein